MVESRLWFNSANDSRYFLVPGLIVLVITLIGAFMTSMVVAREWERGTFEALFVTPVRTDEILLGKIGPLLPSRNGRPAVVPRRGEVPVRRADARLSAAAAGLVDALSAWSRSRSGLLISSSLKSQFLSSQVTLVVTFMPALMLSGFIYDLRSVPLAVQAISYLVPARYFVSLLQTLFLVGDVWSVIWLNAAILAGAAIVLLTLARRATRKSLG